MEPLNPHVHPTMGPLNPHGPQPLLTSTGPLRGANIGCADVIRFAGSPCHPARGPSASRDPRVIAMERGDARTICFSSSVVSLGPDDSSHNPFLRVAKRARLWR